MSRDYKILDGLTRSLKECGLCNYCCVCRNYRGDGKHYSRIMVCTLLFVVLFREEQNVYSKVFKLLNIIPVLNRHQFLWAQDFVGQFIADSFWPQTLQFYAFLKGLMGDEY